MTAFRATFIGKHIGAIGISIMIDHTVEAETPEQARLKLYDTYEHIHGLSLVPLVDGALPSTRSTSTPSTHCGV